MICPEHPEKLRLLSLHLKNNLPPLHVVARPGSCRDFLCLFPGAKKYFSTKW